MWRSKNNIRLKPQVNLQLLKTRTMMWTSTGRWKVLHRI